MNESSRTPDGGACDLESGVCTLPGNEAAPSRTAATSPGPQADRTRITYVTDPICSACWILEPAWRSLTERYRDLIEVRHVYGGLLRGWQGFHDAGNGIRRPEDVAHHWDEFSERSGQPIDSSVWLSDPLDSSYPPSIALAAVRLLAPEAEEAFLRRMREELFLNGRNIARPEVLDELVTELGLPVAPYRELVEKGAPPQPSSSATWSSPTSLERAASRPSSSRAPTVVSSSMAGSGRTAWRRRSSRCPVRRGVPRSPPSAKQWTGSAQVPPLSTPRSRAGPWLPWSDSSPRPARSCAQRARARSGRRRLAYGKWLDPFPPLPMSADPAVPSGEPPARSRGNISRDIRTKGVRQLPVCW